MKISARVLVVFVAVVAAYLLTSYAASFTGAPLGNGGVEGTPITPVVIFVVFPLSLVFVLVAGNILLNRYFRASSSK